jgi:hypothetical protein
LADGEPSEVAEVAYLCRYVPDHVVVGDGESVYIPGRLVIGHALTTHLNSSIARRRLGIMRGNTIAGV